MKVVISRRIPQKGIELLKREGFEIDYNDSTEKLPIAVLAEKCRTADALICLLDDSISEEFIKSCNNLKVIANYAVGFNNINLAAATKQGIVVTNTPDVLTNATADLAFALLLAVARRVVEGHAYIAAGSFNGWGSTLLLGSELTGKTIGIIGAGRIGSAMAKRARGFDMRVLYYSRTPKPALDVLHCQKIDLDTLLQQSDFISVHLPLTDATDHIFDKQKIAQIKNGCYFINTGRGSLVDEAALVDALQSGHLAGAGLDVYEHEPKIHPGLLDLPNVVLLPHIGSATHHARNTMSEMCATAIVDVVKHHRTPLHPINN